MAMNRTQRRQLLQPDRTQEMGTMKTTRIFSDADGITHFEDVNIPLDDHGDIGQISDCVTATGIIFRETPGDYDYDWHPAPRRQFIIILEGEVDIEVGDGSVRRFGSGDILLAEDTTGRGHKSRAVAGRPRRSVFVTLDEPPCYPKTQEDE